MNTKIVMSICAGVLGVMGILLSFLPQEMASYLGLVDTNPILLQLLGALYVSFAMINWTGKANVLGGYLRKTHYAWKLYPLCYWHARPPEMGDAGDTFHRLASNYPPLFTICHCIWLYFIYTP
ncbi:hypothetical protein Q0590_32945 [Rhodocytophaga aerolata]|uniref:Uncharacterized protein n=1 Tax=Rhodocytophaga aerolata TaxID=455078 RepID=A0ABT8RGA0_9BACT|nr:hypothetical protein [Rhodocytophaga aerolata]